VKLENLRIIVDERERKSGIPDLLKAIGMGVEMKTPLLVIILLHLKLLLKEKVSKI